jgi:glycosyltransferase involved in cell wall biosynthesis
VPEVGLAGLPLDYPNTGTAVYVRNLASHLPAAAPEITFRLFVRQPREVRVPVAGQTLRTPFGRFDENKAFWARLDKLAWETVALPLASAARSEDLLHMTYFAAPAVHRARLVVTVHDLVPLAWPGYHRGRASRLYSRIMASTVPRAHAIITVSEHAKKDITRLLHVAEDRIHVTHEAVDCALQADNTGGGESGGRTGGEPLPLDPRGSALGTETDDIAALKRYGIPDRYLLYIGGAEKRKNIEVLVRAWEGIGEYMRSQGARLVIVARFPPPDALYPDIPRLIRERGMQEDVIVVPEVRSEDKGALYRCAVALCFPSRYEGFGLTPLEAMSSGTPVLAADATSLPEVVSDAGWLLAPDDAGAWGEAMRRIVESDTDRETLRAAGLRRAAAFSWEKTARQTADVYRQVLSQ